MSDTTDDTTTTDNGTDELARLRAENASWRRKLRDTEQGHAAAVDAARAEGRGEMTGKLTDALIVAGAAGRFASVQDALQLVNRDSIAGDDGMPDGAKIAEALDSLLTERPHLAGKAFRGSVDQGVRSSAKQSTGDWARDLIAKDQAKQ